MSLKIAISFVLVMLVLMPYTHYRAYKHGRVTMSDEIVEKVGRYTFVLNGKLATLQPQIVDNFGVCSNCHVGGFYGV